MTRTLSARILRVALSARVISATWEMVSTAMVRINSLDIKHAFVGTIIQDLSQSA